MAEDLASPLQRLHRICTPEGKQVPSTSFSKKPASKYINGGLHAPAVLTT